MNRATTFFLFAVPSFLSGLARVADVGAVFDTYNESPTPGIADARAIFADWYAVGQDVHSVMEYSFTETPTEDRPVYVRTP